jgi:uncharacterized membrane protein
MSTHSGASPTASQVPGQLSLRRLERLADIVFAFALLMLLLTIDFAPEESSSAVEAYEYLTKQMTQSLGFVINFLIIAYYWVIHQEYFSYYTSTNKTHIFIELVFLMTIAGMPFNNHFIAAFPTEVAPRLAISSDIFFAGVLSFLSWSYATRGNRLVDAKEMNPELVTFMRRQALIVPGCAIVAAAAAMLHPFAWDAVLTIAPLFAMFFIKRRNKNGGSR